jgi:hypothetical protein
MEREIIRATENNYQELVEQALHPFATQEEVNELAGWFERYSNARYWNGYCHQIDSNYSLYPVHEFVDPEDPESDIKSTHWELR